MVHICCIVLFIYRLAELTAGFTPAQLAGLARRAQSLALSSALYDSDLRAASITRQHLHTALQTSLSGRAAPYRDITISISNILANITFKFIGELECSITQILNSINIKLNIGHSFLAVLD